MNLVAACPISAKIMVASGHKSGKPGILGDFSEHGKLWEFCATLGKNCKVFLVRHLNICKKTAVDWVNRTIRIPGSSDPVQ